MKAGTRDVWKLVIIFAYWNPAWPAIPAPDGGFDPPPGAIDHPSREVVHTFDDREACERRATWWREENSDANPYGETDDSWFVLLAECVPADDLTS